jgi:endoglucanase
MKRLTWRPRRRLIALLLAGVLACAGALVGPVAGPAVAAVAAGGCIAPTVFTLNGTQCTRSGRRHTVTVTNPGNQAGTVGTAASLQIQATDSAAGQTLTYTATGLPAGLSISSSTGLITGTPTTAATSTVTVTVTDSTGASGSATFSWTITPPSGPAPQLQVSGNKMVNSATGLQVVLHGVDRSGGEYACVNGTGVWDGPMDQTAVSAIKSWNVNAVRVPLNEACWNGESYVNSAYAGANYISAVSAYVNLLNSNGIVAILDLHWTDGKYTGPSAGCPSAQAVCQKPMPDSAQAIAFWTSVATTFKGNDAVIFDLFNEPYASRATGSATSGWQCWLNGGTCPGISYQVAGMQAMVNAVRSTGANNVIMVGGEEYANDLGTPGSTSDPSILNYLPADPDHDIAVSWHSYNFNACSNQSCWTSQVQPVIAQVPVVAGEIGENDCASGYVTPLMTWLDSQQTSYLAWAWNADFNCSSGPGLISDYSGTPTNYGAGVKSHLLSLGG